MKKCKTCIHYDACRMYTDVDHVEFKCNVFENKRLYNKLPCLIGDTVYLIRRMSQKESISKGIVTGTYCLVRKQREYTNFEDRPYKIVKTAMKQSYYKQFGYMVFLDPATAEQKLRQLNE